MKHLILFLTSLLFVTCTPVPDTEDVISFAQVDPFLKVFRESNYFSEYNGVENVAAGEHATFQFVVRSSYALKELSIRVSSFMNEQGDTLPAVRTGFVDYVRVGRLTPDQAKDAIIPPSHYYPDPIVEKTTWNVTRDVTQPIWLTANVPIDVTPGKYKATFQLKGKVGNKPFKLKKDIYIQVYPVVLEEPSLWVTNWFGTSPDKMKIFNGGEDVEMYSPTYWSMIEELAMKLKECYSNVILISPLQYVEFKEKDGIYMFDFTQFDKMISIFKNAGILKMIEGGHIAGRSGNWDSQFEPYVPEYHNGKKELKQYPLASSNVQNFYKQFIPALMKHLKENNMGEIYAQHIADEPIASNI